MFWKSILLSILTGYMKIETAGSSRKAHYPPVNSHNSEEYNFEVSCEEGREERKRYGMLRFTDIMLQSSIL